MKLKKFYQLLKYSMVLTALSLTLYANPSQATRSPDFIEEVKCLATNIYFEARGESIKGQIAVAMVTINRVNDGRFADTICGVVHQGKTNSKGKTIRCQFSWYCDGRSDKMPYDSPEAALAIDIAVKAMTNSIEDVTSGALYFSDNKQKIPKHSENVIEIGNHVFFRRG